MDYASLIYGPIYAVLGVPAQILGRDGVTRSVTVLDKTIGVVVGSPVEVQTMLPAAAVRASDLASQGLLIEDVDGCRITFNGATWKITSTRPRPSPNGEADGEHWLLLEGSRQ